MDNKVDIFIEQIKENKNADNSESMSKYMRNKFKFLGIKSPELKKLRKDFISELKERKTIDWEFIEKCWNEEYREFQYIALGYLNEMKKYLKEEDIPKLRKLILDKSWWDTIDALDRIVGSIALNNYNVESILLKWSIEDNIWIRRVAIDHQLLRKEKTNTALLEKIIVNNLNDDEFFINKAIGWSLREYSKTNPGWVRSFLDKYKEQGLSKLSIKEASKYI